MAKIINFKFIGSQGVLPYKMSVNDALEEITRQITEESAWLYLDKKHSGVSDVTEENLIKSKDITLTAKLNGG
tara:strand:- start:193 stop:411 length:219 start_codon:yes stop_codon:yes gene_type:complete